jgi:hypothetical protein
MAAPAHQGTTKRAHSIEAHRAVVQADPGAAVRALGEAAAHVGAAATGLTIWRGSLPDQVKGLPLASTTVATLRRHQAVASGPPEGPIGKWQ